jgi:hypothetical protein
MIFKIAIMMLIVILMPNTIAFAKSHDHHGTTIGTTIAPPPVTADPCIPTDNNVAANLTNIMGILHPTGCMIFTQEGPNNMTATYNDSNSAIAPLSLTDASKLESEISTFALGYGWELGNHTDDGTKTTYTLTKTGASK